MDIKEIVEKKKSILEARFEAYDKYTPCLRSKSAEIIAAMENSDVEALIAVFKSCKIPKKYWLKLILEIKDCYDSEFQSWTLG